MSATTFTLTLPTAREPCFDESLADAPLAGYAKSDSKPVSTPFGGKLLWVGNATCIIEFNGIRFMTDPNFLHQGTHFRLREGETLSLLWRRHAGDHVHLAPGVTAERIKDPAFDYKQCPAVDFIRMLLSSPSTAKANRSPYAVLSHLHEDHFDNLVAEHIRKSLPIISTTHACSNLGTRSHTVLYPLDTWQSVRVTKGTEELTITSMPGKHTLGVTDSVNSVLHLIPPVMGSMIAFKKPGAEKDYNLYISGDTLYYDELKVSERLLVRCTRVF